jgi:hypothetical protein
VNSSVILSCRLDVRVGTDSQVGNAVKRGRNLRELLSSRFDLLHKNIALLLMFVTVESRYMCLDSGERVPQLHDWIVNRVGTVMNIVQV